TGSGVKGVTVLPVHFAAGMAGAPPPDAAAPVPGEPGLFSASLWLMEPGAYSVFTTVEGENGAGMAIVPVNAVATTRLELKRGMGTLLLGLGIFLFFLLLAIAGAAAREADLEPGAEPDRRLRRRGLVVTAAAALFVSLA